VDVALGDVQVASIGVIVLGFPEMLPPLAPKSILPVVGEFVKPVSVPRVKLVKFKSVLAQPPPREEIEVPGTDAQEERLAHAVWEEQRRKNARLSRFIIRGDYGARFRTVNEAPGLGRFSTGSFRDTIDREVGARTSIFFGDKGLDGALESYNSVCTGLVYTGIVKNITLSADERLIEQVREKARRDNTTVNELFREWMRRYAGQNERVREFRELMARLEHVNINRKYTREEMNARNKDLKLLP
jgi:hypothetical protein